MDLIKESVNRFGGVCLLRSAESEYVIECGPDENTSITLCKMSQYDSEMLVDILSLEDVRVFKADFWDELQGALTNPVYAKFYRDLLNEEFGDAEACLKKVLKEGPVLLEREAA